MPSLVYIFLVHRFQMTFTFTFSFNYCRKIEEIYPPPLEEFVYISDNTYTKSQILKMETIVLRILDFDMHPVTSNNLSNRLLQAAKCSEYSKILCQVSFKSVERIVALVAMPFANLNFPFLCSTYSTFPY